MEKKLEKLIKLIQDLNNDEYLIVHHYGKLENLTLYIEKNNQKIQISIEENSDLNYEVKKLNELVNILMEIFYKN